CPHTRAEMKVSTFGPFEPDLEQCQRREVERKWNRRSAIHEACGRPFSGAVFLCFICERRMASCMNEDLLHHRYSRQMLFQPIGPEGQRRLASKAVLIAGMGALGTVLANHMVRAGVGKVRFVDRDYVEASNLQRQMLFDEEDAIQSLPKAVAAQRKLSRINSAVELDGITADVTPHNIEQLLDGIDLVLDGTDN